MCFQQISRLRFAQVFPVWFAPRCVGYDTCSEQALFIALERGSAAKQSGQRIHSQVQSYYVGIKLK